MIRRLQFRCTFKSETDPGVFDEHLAACRDRAGEFISSGRLCNVSFYRYKDMGFLYIEEITGSYAEAFHPEDLFAEIMPFLKSWPREEGDVFFVPMINVYYHHIPEEDPEVWERERTAAVKTRVGRIAFVYPDKLPSYVMHHTAIVNEGLLKGDKYAYISMHENILFSYYEEPRNNVNLRGTDDASEAILAWTEADPESHFDRVKAKGSNFLVIPSLFSVDRVDLKGDRH